MNKAVKQGCMWGCGLVTLVLVAVVGAGTWYAVQMTKDFKEVRASEEELVAAVPADSTYVGSLSTPPAPERIRAFAEVRRGLHERRLQLEQQVGEFKASFAPSGGGPLAFYRNLRAGSELAPVYAAFWRKRNELLRKQAMGPREYDFLYRLIFYTWLEHDPADGAGTPQGTTLAGGRKPGEPDTTILPEVPVWAGDPAELDAALAPYRGDLEATYSPVLNPLEIMFAEGQGRKTVK